MLDTIGVELVQVPRKNDIGEMFDVLSHTFPFDSILKCNNVDPTQPVPRAPYVVDFMLKKGIKTGQVH